MTQARPGSEGSDRLGWLVIRAVFLTLALIQIVLIAKTRGGLSPWADPYSEANALRAAEAYRELGFAANMGLPNVLYGNRFPETGWVRDSLRYPLKEGVYTRYPPLPDWLCGVYERVFGIEWLWAWRLIPVMLVMTALAYFVARMRRAFGVSRAAFVLAAIAAVPMLSTHMHSLHLHGYAEAALLGEFGLLVHALWISRTSRAVIAGMVLLGFVQGWLSFDWAFAVVFLPVPMWMVARADGRRLGVRHLCWLVLATGIGFTVAHMMHFAEVAAFYGSIGEATADFLGRAEFRALGDGNTSYWTELARALQADILAAAWPGSRHFGVCLAVLVAATMAVVSVGRPVMVWRARGALWRVMNLRRFVGAIGAAVVVSLAWVVPMPAMTLEHRHLIPRHLFVGYVVGVLAWALAVERSQAERGVREHGSAQQEVTRVGHRRLPKVPM